MKNNNLPRLRYIALTDVNAALFNIVFAYEQNKAKAQPIWWALWRRCRWQSFGNF